MVFDLWLTKMLFTTHITQIAMRHETMSDKKKNIKLNFFLINQMFK